MVSLSAEVKIWKDLTEISGGDYYVPLDVASVSEKLEILARPPKGNIFIFKRQVFVVAFQQLEIFHRQCPPDKSSAFSHRTLFRERNRTK